MKTRFVAADCKNGCYFAARSKDKKLVPFNTFLELLANPLCTRCPRGATAPCPIGFLEPVYCEVTESEFQELEETYGVCAL